MALEPLLSFEVMMLNRYQLPQTQRLGLLDELQQRQCSARRREHEGKDDATQLGGV